MSARSSQQSNSIKLVPNLKTTTIKVVWFLFYAPLEWIRTWAPPCVPKHPCTHFQHHSEPVKTNQQNKQALYYENRNSNIYCSVMHFVNRKTVQVIGQHYIINLISDFCIFGSSYDVLMHFDKLQNYYGLHFCVPILDDYPYRMTDNSKQYINMCFLI